MDINGITSNLKISNSNDIKKKEIRDKKNEKLREISDLNIESSKIDIDSFMKAKKITEKIVKDIRDVGSDIIDKSRLSGKKIYDLIQD